MSTLEKYKINKTWISALDSYTLRKLNTHYEIIREDENAQVESNAGSSP